ncbi:MAG: MopE-related protein [bacterium]
MMIRTGGAAWLVAIALAAVGCEDSPNPGIRGDAGIGDAAVPDTGMTFDGGQIGGDQGPRVDRGMPPVDMGRPPVDMGQPPADMAVPPADMAVPPADMAVPPADMGEPPVDMAVPPEDMAVLPPDMGPCRDCDGDGFTEAEGDCDDGDPAIHPGAEELCDGLDNDCDDRVDGQSEACYAGPDGTNGVGICQQGVRICRAGAFGACEGEVLPAAAEICGNGRDDDCDGQIDDGCDRDGDGFTVADGDCNDDDRAINPGAAEICDGIDNDCDRVTDGMQEVCYSGPRGTAGVGVCREGARTCIAGMFGGCAGEVVPGPEACGNDVDDDCDGNVDEGCNVVGCPDLDLDSVVVLSSSCLAAGSQARAAIYADVLDNQGNAIPGITVDIQAQGNVDMTPVGRIGNRWWRRINVGNEAGQVRFTITAACNGAAPLALNTSPVLTIAPGLEPGDDIATGGCGDADGNLEVRVIDANTGLPLQDARVMVGPAGEDTFQRDAGQYIRGVAGASPNRLATGADGVARLLDFGDVLRGEQILTVGAEGYEYVSLFGLDASQAVVPLRPIDPPAPATVNLSGDLSAFDSLAADGQTDAGIVLGSFNIQGLAVFGIGSLLGRYDCWDPITQGFVGGLVNEVPTPGNLMVPQQQEVVFGTPVTIERHSFLFTDFPAGRDELVGVSGKMPTQELANLLLNGGSLADTISLLTLREIGVLRNQDFAADRAGMSIPLSSGLAPNSGCDVSNVPAGADIFCVVAGDWEGGNGTGRLFPMGLKSATAAAVDMARPRPVALPLTTVAPQGPFNGIGYVGAAVARLQGMAVAEPLRGAVSGIVDRHAVGAQGGRFAANSFLNPTTLTRVDRTFSWDEIANPNSPAVDTCRFEVYRQIRESYDPGACSNNLIDGRDEPVWTVYTDGDPGEVALPVLPADFPRARTFGYVNPGATPEDDRLLMRITCMALGEAPDFDFDAGNFRDLVNGLTHATTNARNY